MTTAEDPLPDLMTNTRHKSPLVRLNAIKALGKLGWLAKDALPALAKSLHDPDGKVREAAAQAIGQFGPDAISTLIEMLNHQDKYVRRNAVWALGKLGPLARVSLRDLCQRLQDEDPRTASGAAQALGSMGTDGADAIPSLAEAMRGTNIVLCRLAAKALSQIGRPALQTLIAHLKHHDPFVRGEAAVALGWMGPTAAPAIPYLLQLLNQVTVSRPTPPQGMAPVTPPTTVAAAPAEPPSAEDGCRASAAQALGRIGPSAIAAVPTLENALRDHCTAIRQAAELSLRQIREN